MKLPKRRAKRKPRKRSRKAEQNDNWRRFEAWLDTCVANAEPVPGSAPGAYTRPWGSKA
jgi:hypothetical protein